MRSLACLCECDSRNPKPLNPKHQTINPQTLNVAILAQAILAQDCHQRQVTPLASFGGLGAALSRSFLLRPPCLPRSSGMPIGAGPDDETLILDAPGGGGGKPRWTTMGRAI